MQIYSPTTQSIGLYEKGIRLWWNWFIVLHLQTKFCDKYFTAGLKGECYNNGGGGGGGGGGDLWLGLMPVPVPCS